MLKNKWFLISLIFLCWASVSTSFAGYYYYQYDLLLTKSREIIHVNLLIDYGNGTRIWYNNTAVRKGATLLDVTIRVARVNFTFYVGMGSFVNAINNVWNKHPKYWMWWMWIKGTGWTEGPVAADKYVVSDGESLCWFYEDTSVSPLPRPSS